MKRQAPISALLAALALLAVPAANAALVAYYPFEDGTGTTITDATANGHTGTLQNPGGTDWVPGHVGSWALDLSTNQYVTTLNSTATQLGMNGNNPKTIALWSLVRTFSDDGLFQLGQTGSVGQMFCLRTRAGVNQFRAQFWGSPDFDATLGASQNNWRHYALVHDGTQGLLFYDGKLVAGEPSTLNTNDGRSLEIGRYGNSQYLDGIVDDMAVYNQALAANQVAYLYNGGNPATLPPAVPGLGPFVGIGPDGSQSSQWGIREVRNNGTLNNIYDAVASIQSGTGTIFDGYAQTVNHNDPQAAGGGGYFGNASKAPFLSNTAGDDGNIAFIARSSVIIPADGTYTFGFRSDDGAMLKLDGASFTRRWGGGLAVGDTLVYPGPTGDSNTGGATFLTAGAHDIEFIYFELGGGAYLELWAAPGNHGSFDPSVFRLVGDVANGGLGLTPEPTTLALLALGGLGLVARRRRR